MIFFAYALGIALAACSVIIVRRLFKTSCYLICLMFKAMALSEGELEEYQIARNAEMLFSHLRKTWVSDSICIWRKLPEEYTTRPYLRPKTLPKGG